MSAEPKFIVAFDETHNPRGKLSSNYKQLQKIIESEGYICQEFTSYPITREALQPIDIFIIACPDQSRYDRNEIKAIRDWVTQDGGGLLLLSHAGGDKGRRSNLSELAEEYGITFENDQVLDKEKNVQNLENYLLIDNFIVDHPIVKGISKLCFRASSSLTAMNLMVKAIILSGDKSNPPAVPLLVATDIEEGRVVGCGSYEMFRDKVTGGISFGDNPKLMTNILDYLKTDKKYEMKKNNPVPAYSSPQVTNIPQDMGGAIPTGNINMPLPSFDPNSIPTFNSEIKISKKGDLAVVFGAFMQEFINFKNETINRMQQFEARFLAFLRSIIDTEEEVYMKAPEPSNYSTTSDDQLVDPRAMLAGLNGSYEPTAPSSAQINGLNPPGAAPPTGLNPPGGPPMSGLNPPSAVDSQSVKLPSKTDLPSLTPLPPRPRASNQPQESFGSPQLDTSVGVDSPKADVWSQTDGSSNYWENQTMAAPEQGIATTDASFAPEPETPAAAPPPKKTINIEELQTELRTLNAKIDSVKRLKEFITKKFESGGMNEDSYKKQIEKLNNDLKAADFRVEEINALIKKYS